MCNSSQNCEQSLTLATYFGILRSKSCFSPLKPPFNSKLIDTMNSSVEDTIFSLIEPSSSIKLSIEGLSKGIDNYHVDVKLSRKFLSDTKKLVALLVPQIAAPTPKTWDNSKQFKQLRASYLDMMTVLIHRVKTDLSADHISFLQLATIKHVIKFSRSQLDSEIKTTASRLTELQSKGASEALAVDQRLFWLKRNYDSIIYSVNKPIFTQLQRVEERQLASIRKQFLGEHYDFAFQLLLNPLLYGSTLSGTSLLLNEYNLWDLSGEDSGFLKLDKKLSELLSKNLKDLPLSPLSPEKKIHSTVTEIHDELGGLFQLQNFTGPSEDSKDTLEETLDWLEIGENVDLLFDGKNSAQWLASVRAEHGFLRWWKCKKDVKKLNRFLLSVIRLLSKEKLLPQFVASSVLRRSLNPLILEHVELKTLCQFLAGKTTLTKLQDTSGAGKKLGPEQIKLLEQQREQVIELAKTPSNDLALKILHDIGRFRRDLKLYRFAHRAFNRMSILTEEDDLKLSKSAGTLYQLPMRSEAEVTDAKISHHAILKADVRGSTTVTDELSNKGLNPASFFSMRFFNPINKILETYDANKVFIEGDAIILSFLEYENAPEQWFSVSRACGYAKDMLIITGSNNRYSTQMGLPLLELGVGICYSSDAPRFLYDGEHPIMISRAIGLADRMSGCSWNLRAAITKGLFNVDVLRIADGETNKGEKGQHYARYNVNGINIDDLAFEKLKSEISLKSVKMKLNGENYTFHVGKYPDAKGQKKDLVIREGNVGVWENNQIQPERSTEESYYEVVVNRKVIPLVLDAAKSSVAYQPG